MIKQAYNKENHNLVFKITKITREDIGNDKGVKLFYVGDLIDGSKDPAKITPNYRVPVNGFDVDWSEIPVTAPISSLAPKSITENGVYNPKDDGVDGYNSVAVEVAADISDYINDVIDCTHTDKYFFQRKLIKKFPVFKIVSNYLSYTFYNYSGSVAPIFDDTSKVKDWDYCFRDTGIKEFPQYDTSAGTNFNCCFYNNYVETIPLLDFGKAQNIYSVVSRNSSTLKNLGGFKDLGKNYSPTQSENYNYYMLDLGYCEKLTRESVLNVFNNLYDIASIGVKPQKIQIHKNVAALLTEEELAIPTNKGWSLVILPTS